jgi:PTS system nitrogen regulatory IIA component
MKIVDFARPDLVVPDLHEREKIAVLRELAGHFAAHCPGVDAEALVKVLVERERLASTAIGEGVAIPHAKFDAVGQLTACVGRAREGVNFDSIDGKPTYVFFVLVAPQSSTGAHLKALARISRLFKDPGFRTRLMQANDAGELYRVIADEDAKY